MAANIHFELVSPVEKLVSEDVYLAEMPGDNGMFGVLHGHCSLVSSLDYGVVRLHKEKGGEVREYFIAGGFADVTRESCTVLAEEAIEVKALDKPALETEVTNLNEALALSESDDETRQIKNKLTLASEKLAVASR